MPQAKIALVGLVLSLLPGVTSGDSTIIIQSGVDTAPYAFIPTLSRHLHPTLYAFESTDEATGISHTFETFIRFDLEDPVVPAGEVVSSAIFFIPYAFDFVGFGDTPDVPGEVNVHQITSAWDPPTLTWLNRPSVGPVIDTVSGITGFGTMTFDVTELVTAWSDGTHPNNGLALISDTGRVIGMNSFEMPVAAGLKANLVINTVSAPAVPTAGGGMLVLLVALVGAIGVRHAGCGPLGSRRQGG